MNLTMPTAREAVPVLLVLGALLCPATARADALPPPPENCPPGSTGQTGHCGVYCAPRVCSDVSQCQPGEVCQEQPLCIGQLQGPCGNVPPDAAPEYIDTVEGYCHAQAPCVKGQCQKRKVCSPPPDAGTGGGSADAGSAGAGPHGGGAGGAAPGTAGPTVVDQGCGCTLPGAPLAARAGLLVFAAAIALGARRCRRAPPCRARRTKP
ncbi:MAG: hypothetical protein HY744_01245 [Deltaproteobacteria bacterium]|nr:hypothetical protein [Deltaproteobacteria bacterium]